MLLKSPSPSPMLKLLAKAILFGCLGDLVPQRRLEMGTCTKKNDIYEVELHRNLLQLLEMPPVPNEIIIFVCAFNIWPFYLNALINVCLICFRWPHPASFYFFWGDASYTCHHCFFIHQIRSAMDKYIQTQLPTYKHWDLERGSGKKRPT